MTLRRADVGTTVSARRDGGSPVLWSVALGCLLAFASGTLWRPAGSDGLYDLVLYNGVYLACAGPRRRARQGRQGPAQAVAVRAWG